MFVNMAMSRTHQPESLASNGGASVFTIEEIDERVQQLLAENAELRSKSLCSAFGLAMKQ